MVWYWTRDTAEMRLETQYDEGTEDFILVLATETSSVTERYKDLGAFKTRVSALARHLESEQWKNTGPAVVVPDDFPSGRFRVRD